MTAGATGAAIVLDDPTRLPQGAGEGIHSGLIDEEAIDRFLAADPDDALALWFGDDAPPRERVDSAVAAIDRLLSTLVDAILAHPHFAALEGAWRGVRWLVSGLGVDGMARIRLLDARWPEFARDFDRSADLDRSALFDLIYAQEFDMPGGVPFSLLVGIYQIRHRPTAAHPTDDIEVLRQVADVAAAAFAPIVLDAAPGLFGVDRFVEMGLRRTLSADFRGTGYARLQSFQARPSARFVGVAAPPIRLRGPWRGRRAGDCGFRYDADEGGACWGAAAFAVAHVALRAFADYRWPAAVRGVVRDELTAGLIAALPPVDFETDAPGKAVKFPVEVHFSETIDRELAEAGFICVRRIKDTPYLAIHNMPSLHRPTTGYDRAIARSNQQLGTMLNYILCVSRFAHYIKVIGRESIGSLTSADEIEQRLQRWVNRYVTGGQDVSFEQKARFPLQEARIAVSDVAGSPGSYECAVMLKPHFQLDQAISEFHLVTVVQAPGGST